MSTTRRERPGEPRIRTILRNGIEAVYSRAAWPYDLLSEVLWAGYWRLWQRSSLPFVQGPRVLEVGMGTGNLQLDLNDAGYDTFGVDLSPSMLEVAARKARRHGIPRLKTCRANAQALPFPDGCFNTVLATNPSGYVVRQETHDEIARVLLPGGRVVFMVGGRLRRGTRARVLARTILSGLRASHRGAKAEGEQFVIYPYTGGDAELSYWVMTIKGCMQKAGLHVSVFIGPHESGSVLLLTGDKAAA